MCILFTDYALHKNTVSDSIQMCECGPKQQSQKVILRFSNFRWFFWQNQFGQKVFQHQTKIQTSKHK